MSTLKYNTWLNTDNTENYKCRAWVNFNGTGTVAIRASGNVSSITDNGTGDYTVAFTNAMSDTNYSLVTSGGVSDSGDPSVAVLGIRMSPYPGTGSSSYTMTTTSVRLQLKWANASSQGTADSEVVGVAIFR
jgi:hypothetical protein